MPGEALKASVFKAWLYRDDRRCGGNIRLQQPHVFDVNLVKNWVLGALALLCLLLPTTGSSLNLLQNWVLGALALLRLPLPPSKGCAHALSTKVLCTGMQLQSQYQ